MNKKLLTTILATTIAAFSVNAQISNQDNKTTDSSKITSHSNQNPDLFEAINSKTLNMYSINYFDFDKDGNNDEIRHSGKTKDGKNIAVWDIDYNDDRLVDTRATITYGNNSSNIKNIEVEHRNLNVIKAIYMKNNPNFEIQNNKIFYVTKFDFYIPIE